MNKSKDWKFK